MKRMWNVVWRAIRVLPVVGVFIVLATSSEVLRRKGNLLGALAILLDILPVVCIVKAVIEIFTGDLIPNRAEPEAIQPDQNPVPSFEPAA